MWDSRRLITLQTFTVCYRDSFNLCNNLINRELLLYLLSTRNWPWRPIRLWDVTNSTLSRQSTQMAVRLSALRTSRDLLPRNIHFLLLELSSVTGWVHPMVLHGMKDYVNWTFIYYKWHRTSNLPAGIIEPYPLRYRAPQCVWMLMVTKKKSNLITKGINNSLYKVSEFLVKDE
jgi:hypothetical protein